MRDDLRPISHDARNDKGHLPAHFPENTKHLHNIYSIGVGPTLYKCYTDILCLLGLYV